MKSYLSLIPISAKVRKRQNRMMILCIIISVLLVTTIFSAADMIIRGETVTMQAKHGNWHIQVNNISDEIAEEISNRPDVTAVGWSAVFNEDADQPYTIGERKATLYGTDETYLAQLADGMEEGAFPQSDQEVVLSSNAKLALDVQLGDSVTVQTPAGNVDLTISGFGSDDQEYYTCAGYSKRVNPCTTHHISIKKLKKLVTEDLRRVTHFAAEHEREFISMLVSCSMREQKRALAEMQRELENSQSRYDELDNIIQHLYEDKIKGQLTEERFTKLSAGYEAEQKGLEGTIRELSEQIAQKTDKTINIDRFMKLVKKNTSFEELTPTLLNTFIEKILVHEIEVDAEGKRSQKIEIVYNFIGSVELPEEAYREAAEEPIELPLRESRKRKKSA